MTPLEEERRAAGRERALVKARRVQKRNTARRRRDEVRDAERFRAWLVRERETFTLAQLDRSKRPAWLKVLRERPALYGRREAA